MNASRTSYEAGLRDAVDATCRELGHDLLVVYGRSLQEPLPSSAAHNAIFHLIGPETVDGILLLSSCLAGYAGLEGIIDLTRRYGSMPICSIGLAVPGIPSVVSDNRTGMDAALEHIVSNHGCRRVLFVAGWADHPEARVRLEVYEEVLQRHSIQFEPALVINGRFTKDAAYTAVQEFLKRGVPFDAVVAANDAMAAGATEALRRSGRRVPRDVPVTGYDDLHFARLGNPPLTTVRQPLDAMARAAVTTLLERIDGCDVPLRTELPTELVLRRSCGCNPRASGTHRIGPRTGGIGLADHVRDQGPALQQALTECSAGDPRHAPGDTGRLLAGLTAELEGQAGSFVGTVEALLQETTDDDERSRAVQIALAALRRALFEIPTPELEDVLEEAAILVALHNTTGTELDRLANDEAYYEMTRRGETTSMALDLPTLERVLLKNLPEQGIRTAFLSRYTGPARDELDAFACLLDGARVTPEFSRFPARKLLPPGIYGESRRHTSLVLPMAFEGQQLGVAVFEYGEPTLGYQVVRDQISAALRNLAVHHEIVETTTLHERSVQERLATTKRMQLLSMLAGGVAHDLNNALGPLVALPDVILGELAQLPADNCILEDIRADIESIKTASLRATQTIKDLLTLGRQGQLAKEPLDLNRVVQGCVEAGALRFLRAEHTDIAFAVELAAEPPVILGSEAHVARAISNLLRNSVEAIQGGGQVTIETLRRRVTMAISGYEPIEPGDYALVRVTDDGAGIAPWELGRVFEPFFTKKRTGEESGSGLGLAIVHGVAKEHGGYVDVTSTLGEGTTFTLYFPVAEGATQDAHVALCVRPGKARILIVDDEPMQLRTGRRVLGRLGYHVDTLSSGQRACDLFVRAAASGQSPYDLVILDMLLNEQEDGLHVLERIQRSFPDQKGIVVSGHAPTERAHTAVQEGLSWLAKPYTAEALAFTVQAVLTG